MRSHETSTYQILVPNTLKLEPNTLKLTSWLLQLIAFFRLKSERSKRGNTSWYLCPLTLMSHISRATPKQFLPKALRCFQFSSQPVTLKLGNLQAWALGSDHGGVVGGNIGPYMAHTNISCSLLRTQHCLGKSSVTFGARCFTTCSTKGSTQHMGLSRFPFEHHPVWGLLKSHLKAMFSPTNGHLVTSVLLSGSLVGRGCCAHSLQDRKRLCHALVCVRQVQQKYGIGLGFTTLSVLKTY